MKKFLSCISILCISLIVFMISCEKEEKSENKIGPVTYSENVTLIDDNTLQASLINFDTLTGVYNFSENPGVAVGDILISESGEGFIRRVIKIDNNSSGVVISTDFASICEAVESVTASKKFNIIPELKSTQLLVDGVTIDTNRMKGENDNQLLYNINWVIHDEDGQFNTTNDQIVLNGTYGMSSEIEANIEIQNKDLNLLLIKYAITENANISISSSISSTFFEKEKRIIQHKFLPFSLFPGCVITPILQIYAGVEINNTGEIGFQIEKSKDYIASVEYKNGIWSTDKSITENEVSFEPILSNALTAKGYLKPKLLLKINGVISPKLEAELYNQLKANASLQGIDWEISKGFTMSVGVEMKIFKKTLFDYNADFFDVKGIIDQGSFYDQIPIADFTASSTSITIGESVQFTDQSTNSPTSWSWNFGDGGTSAVQNPSHTYSSAGTYSVSLTATNSNGSDIETRIITVNEPVINPIELNTNLISYWPIDETVGSTVYDAYSSNNCTVNAGVTINQIGLRGKAASFAVTSGGLTTGKKASVLGIGGGHSKSVSIWIKPGSSMNVQSSCGIIDIGSRANQKQFGIKLYGYWMFDSWYGAVRIGTDNNKLADGEWHHIVVTYNSDGHKVRTYLDGSFVTEDASKTLNTGDDYGFSIGIGSQGKYAGLIDEVGLWSRVLSETEVQTLYNNGNGLQYPF